MIAFAALALLFAGPVLDSGGLRHTAEHLRGKPDAPAEPTPFRLEFPIVPDRRTDLEALQNPAGYSYDRASGVLNIDVDLGVITPDNFKSFDKLDLWKAPPLRTLFFSTRTGRDVTLNTTFNGRGDPESTQGYRVSGESFGLAIATSAQDRGIKGGDLPDDFAVPFLIQMHVSPDRVGSTAGSLRLRVEGHLRTIGGHAVLCGRSGGGGYAVDEFTQKTPNVIAIQQCFLPAMISSISLVRTTGGPPLKVWTRASADPTPETEATRVQTVQEAIRLKPDGGPSSSPNATAPLPKR